MNRKKSSYSTSESYILRIYRRNTHDPQELVGTIEEVMEVRIRSFNTQQSLLEQLLQNEYKRNEQ